MPTDLLQTIAIAAVPILLAVTMHEAAHAKAAQMLGDDTAWRLGRASINPLRHIDVFGTLLLPLAAYLVVGFILGWAKPVPVAFDRLRNQKRDTCLVALAGPAANLLMLMVWTLMLSAPAAHRMATIGVTVNLIFIGLNLLPILPLDGGRVLLSLLPERLAARYAKTEPYGLLAIAALTAVFILR